MFKMIIIKFLKAKICVLFVVYNVNILVMNAWCQGYNINNPTDLTQPWISNINPATVSHQDVRVSIGLKVFHFGFLPDDAMGLNESHINASFPFYLPLDLGIGCDLHYFSAANFSEIFGSIMLSRKLFHQISAGLKLGFVGLGFSRDNFTVVHENDPLLSGSLSKNSFNIGFGIYWNPGRISLGLAFDHINQPDIGIDTEARLPLEISTAIGYRYSKFMPAILMQHDGNRVRYGMAISMEQRNLGLLRFSYQNTMPIKAEIQFNLSRKSSLQYGYDLPGENLSSATMGSHELTFNYIIAREPDIAKPGFMMSTNILKIYEEKVVRSMPGDMIPTQLERIDDLAPGYLDTKGRNNNLLIIAAGNLSQYETQNIRMQRYAGFEKEILRTLQDNPAVNIIINADKQTIGDARSLKKYFENNGYIASKTVKIARVNSAGKTSLIGFQPGRTMISRKEPVLSNDYLMIRLHVPGKTRRLREWKLMIMDEKNNIVKTFQGKDELITQVAWNWRNAFGELVSPGEYRCVLKLRAMSGKEIDVISEPLQVMNIKRTVALRFKKDQEVQYSRGY